MANVSLELQLGVDIVMWICETRSADWVVFYIYFTEVIIGTTFDIKQPSKIYQRCGNAINLLI
jgi:hypothetical protein